MLNVDELCKLIVLERDSPQLQPLPGTFREEARAYIARLREAQASAGDYREVDMLRDEERNARTLLEGLGDRRLGKVLGLANLYACGVKSMDLGTVQGADREAFDRLVTAIREARCLISLELL